MRHGPIQRRDGSTSRSAVVRAQVPPNAIPSVQGSWSHSLEYHCQNGTAYLRLVQAHSRSMPARGRIAGGTIDQAGMDYQWLGRAALLLGRIDDARRLANCSLQYSPSHPGFAAHALHLLGDIVTDPDQFNAEEGETHYHKALALAQPRGMRPLIAHCHFGLGKLYRRTGKHEQACKHLAPA